MRRQNISPPSLGLAKEGVGPSDQGSYNLLQPPSRSPEESFMPAHKLSALQNLLNLTYWAESGREETCRVLLVLANSVYIGAIGQK